MRVKSCILGAWFAGAVFFFVSAGAAQSGPDRPVPDPVSVRYVCSSGDDGNDGLSGETPFRTLGRAVEAARSPSVGTIVVMGELNGTSEDPGPRESVFYIDDSGDGELLILGLDHQAKLSARGSGKRVITITGGARVRLENITLSGGRAENGGGVFVEDAALTLGDGVLVTGNRAVLDGGGIVVYSGSLTLSGAEIGKNQAGDDGGGVYTRRGNFTLRGNSRIVDNLADCGGGVCVDDGSSFVMEGRVLVGGNKAAGRQGTGGGLCVGMDSEMVMRDGLVIDNKAKRGAGVYNALGRFVLEGGSVSGNVARERGGGICVEQGGLILKAGAVSVNRAASAGGVYAMGEYRRSGGVEMNGNIPEDEGGPDAGD